MSTVTIQSGGLVTFDPDDIRVVTFDWDQLGLAANVTISTSTWTITAIRQSGASALTSDNPQILSGSRKTSVRLNATTATVGDEYEVANKIVTNESPSQTKEQSFRVLIEDL